MSERSKIIAIAKRLGVCPFHPSTVGDYYTVYDSDAALLEFIDKRLSEIVTRKTDYDWKQVAKKT